MKFKHIAVSPEDHVALSAMGFHLWLAPISHNTNDREKAWLTYCLRPATLRDLVVGKLYSQRYDDLALAAIYVNAPDRDVLPDSPFVADWPVGPKTERMGFDNIIEAATFLRLHVIEEERRRLGELADAIKATSAPVKGAD